MRIGKRQIEFSKLIYMINIIFVAMVTIASFILMFMSGRLGADLSPINVIVPSAFGELGLHSAFYLNKAKAENTIKLSKELDKGTINDKHLRQAQAIMNSIGLSEINEYEG